MRLILALSVLVLLLAGGYYYVATRARAPAAAVENAPTEQRDATVRKFAISLEREIPHYKLRAAGRDISPVRVAELENHVDAILKQKGDPRVAAHCKPATAIGKRLCRIAMTVRLGKLLSDDETKELGAAYLAGFALAHDETMNEVRAALSGLSGAEFAQERLGVFAVLDALPDTSSDVRTLALTELTTQAPDARPTPEQAGGDQELMNQARSLGPAQALPIYAYRMYLDSVASDPDAALSGTLEVLQSQKDAGVRELLAGTYITQYPNMKPQLYQQLSQAGMNLPDIQPGSQFSAESAVAAKVLAGP